MSGDARIALGLTYGFTWIPTSVGLFLALRDNLWCNDVSNQYRSKAFIAVIIYFLIFPLLVYWVGVIIESMGFMIWIVLFWIFAVPYCAYHFLNLLLPADNRCSEVIKVISAIFGVFPGAMSAFILMATDTNWKYLTFWKEHSPFADRFNRMMSDLHSQNQ